MPSSAGRVLGVLGGMGPAATADFLFKLAARTPAERDQDHIPTLVYSDPTTPDRSDGMIHGGPDPLPALIHGIEYLCSTGVSAIAVPCNSAYYWFEEMSRAATVPLLHIVDTVAAQVQRDRPGIEVLGLMSTEGTAKSGVYDRLADYGHEIIDLTDLGEDSPVTTGIRRVKAGDLQSARDVLTQAAGLLIDRGAQGIIYGCTDISTVLGQSPKGVTVPVWDSADALAAGCVEHLHSRSDQRLT